MLKIDFPYAEDFFPEVYHTASIGEDTVFWRTDGSIFEYDPKLRDAEKYIRRYTTDENIFWNPEHYNFSLFKGIDEKKKSIILFEMNIVSRTINSILWISPDTKLRDVKSSFLWKSKLSKDEAYKKSQKIWVLNTNIYPDAPYVLSLNYQDFPIGYISFDIVWNTIYIQQIQASDIMDQYLSFESWRNHLLQWFEWRKVLVTFFEDYLRNKGFSWTVVIQAGENNMYHNTKEDDDIEKENKRKAQNSRIISSYNNTATDLNYEMRVKGIWRKQKVRDYWKRI